MGTIELTRQWSLAKRLLFRFAFVYLIVYNIEFPLGMILGFFKDFPFLVKIAKGYQDGWDAVIKFVGRKLFQIEITILPAGSGDTTWNYVQILCLSVLALSATAVWSIYDYKRPNYVRLLGFLRFYVRYALSFTMIVYGSVKVIKSQFPDPSLDRLLQPFGDASPMGLLWAFMGASWSYNVFSGAGELLGALLLTTRRTSLLGALVCIGVLGHVVALNFSYDVPVKLLSTHLLLMAVFLVAPDLRRMADLFLFNRPVEAANIPPLTRWPWINVVVVLLRTGIVAAYLGLWLYNAQSTRKEFGDLMPRSSLYGVWNVEEFTLDGSNHPALVGDKERWRRVVFDYPKRLAVQLMNDSRLGYGLKLDEEKKTLELTEFQEPNWKASFNFERPEPDVLVLEGTIDGKKIRAKCRRMDTSDFRLLSRGFHWINEFPFNR
jgi:hypothetical protein